MDLEVLISAHLKFSLDIRAHKIKKNNTPCVLDGFQTRLMYQHKQVVRK
jgi:hypothetical protein